MPTPDLDVVRRVLAKNGRDMICRRAVEDAWEGVKAGYPQRVWWRRKSTSAGVMWEHSVDNAAGALIDDKGVQVVPHHDTASIIFDDLVLLRFKKASIQLYTANFPTYLSTLFHRHQVDLFGYEGLQRVELAHVFNRFATALDWIGVVAREGRRILWYFELGSPGGSVVEDFPILKPLAPAGDRVLHPIKPEEETSDHEDD